MSIRLDTRTLLDAVETFGKQVVATTVDALHQHLDYECPVRDGVLRDSYVEWIDGLSARVQYTADHAAPVDAGPSEHAITGNPLLAFYWPVTGRTMVVRSVWWTPDGPGSTGAVARNRGWFTDTVRDFGPLEFEHAARNTTVVV